MKNGYFLITILIGAFLSGCQPQLEANFSNTVNPEKETEGVLEVNTNSQIATTTDEPMAETPEPTEEPAPVKVEAPIEEPAKTEAEEPKPLVTPKKLDYEMSFVSQAPYAVWDELHEEACEEASMIMVDKYFSNETLTAHTMEQEILDLVEWEKINGYQVDVTAQEASDILNNYFKLSAKITTGVTVDRIKQELTAEKMIIIPVAGRELGNPYFQTPGPIYHMLVIKGFDDNTQEFITNDPGTKRGKDFRYSYQQLINAIHDWNHELAQGGMTDEEIAQGRKVMILVGN